MWGSFLLMFVVSLSLSTPLLTLAYFPYFRFFLGQKNRKTRRENNSTIDGGKRKNI